MAYKIRHKACDVSHTKDEGAMSTKEVYSYESQTFC